MINYHLKSSMFTWHNREPIWKSRHFNKALGCIYNDGQETNEELKMFIYKECRLNDNLSAEEQINFGSPKTLVYLVKTHSLDQR